MISDRPPGGPMGRAIEVRGLVKSYPGLVAVDHIDFEVETGTVFAFLGPNGAGKTTTTEILEGLRRRSEGEVRVLGLDPWVDGARLHRRIGVIPQEFRFFDKITPTEAIAYYAALFGTRVDPADLLRRVALEEKAGARFDTLSGGQKQKLGLALALTNDPEVCFLDEPTTGLDPQSRATVWEYLEGLNKKEGITIFLTTQYLEEADRLCERLCIVDSGKIVAEGTPSDLKREIGADAISISMKNKQGRSDETVKAAAREIVSKMPEVVNVLDSGDGLTIYAKEGGYFIPELVRAFDKTDIALVSINLSTPSLDDVFLKHTGKRIRVEELVKDTTSGRFGGRRR